MGRCCTELHYGTFWGDDIAPCIRYFRDEIETGAEIRVAIVSGIVTRDAPVSYWPIFFHAPEVFAKVNSDQFPSR